MQTEIILKDYSELNIWQKLKLKMFISKVFSLFEELILKTEEASKLTANVTDQLVYSAFQFQIAQLMCFYNSEEYSDYRVIELSLEYLKGKATTPQDSYQKGCAKVGLEIFESMLDKYSLKSIFEESDSR